MEIVEIKSTSYPNAAELPNKSGRPIAKRQGSPGGNSRMEKHRSGSYMPRLGGRLLTEQQKSDRDATASGKMILIIIAGKKRRFIREKDYLEGRYF